ncbi:putative sialoadhesin-like [Triplophysa rosa]|uniref:Sialoadhesin-like n=1 Tax=Triplophysa rosa TaxID=992332 RepID=A0A9W7WPS0_TRIRA|nr:putative sialoadhesin-like [Triplophysa rosa]
MAAQLFLVAKGDRNGCKEIHGFSNMSEDEVKQLFSADGDENIQLFSVQLDDISDENPLVLALRLLEQDGSYGPQFMEMELGSHLLNRTDGKGVEMYVQLLDDLTASVMCRGTETTQTSGTKALKDVFYDLSVPLSNQGAIAVELGNILDLDGSPTEEVSRDENDCSDTDSQEEVFYDAVDQLSSYDESDLPEESETEVFYECYEDLSEDQAVDSLVCLLVSNDIFDRVSLHEVLMSSDEVKETSDARPSLEKCFYLCSPYEDGRVVLIDELITAVGVDVGDFTAVDVERRALPIDGQILRMDGRRLKQEPGVVAQRVDDVTFHGQPGVTAGRGFESTTQTHDSRDPSHSQEESRRITGPETETEFNLKQNLSREAFYGRSVS